MRGKPSTPPDLTPQGVSVAVNLAFKDAGFVAPAKILNRARYAFAEEVTDRAFLVSYQMLNPEELEQVWQASQNYVRVRAFLASWGLNAYRQHAKSLLHGFTVSTPAPLPDPEAVLVDRIAAALKEAAHAT